MCILDNRGVGNSSSPVKQQAYSTTLMAQDALAVMVRRSRSFSLEGGVLQAGAWWAHPACFLQRRTCCMHAYHVLLNWFAWAATRAARTLCSHHRLERLRHVF